MAGRGTDIVLGPGIADMGGLHIVGTERHEARRIDNQLRGRAGRQGDPGSSRFFVSFEDDLLRIFAPESMQGWLKRVGMEDGMAIESRMVSRWIEKAQKRVEEYNFEVRKNVLEYDEVMDEQRKSIYSWRQKFVENRGVEDELLVLIEDAVGDGVDFYASPRTRLEERDFDGLSAWFERKFGQKPEIPADCRNDIPALENYLIGLARELFERKAQAVGKAQFLDFGRFLALRTIDIKWKDHLHAMDVLRSGIGLRGYAQLDPKIEYKAEGGEIFEQMLMRVADEVTDLLYRVRVEEERERKVTDIWQVSEERHDQFNVGAYARQQEQVADTAGVRRRHQAHPRPAESRPQRPLPLRQRQEVQALLRTASS